MKYFTSTKAASTRHRYGWHSAFLAFFLLTAGIQAGQSRGLDLGPSDLPGGASVTLLQSGHANSASITQKDRQRAYVSQAGSHNEANTVQRGNGNSAMANQSGAGNVVSVLQAGANNDAYITQGGDGNNANVTQYRHGNDTIISQAGTANEASVTQTGANKTVTVDQSGLNHSASITASTSMTISQYGVGMAVRVVQ